MSTARAAKLALRAIRAARTHLERAACTSDGELSRRAGTLNADLWLLAESARRLAVDLEARQAKAKRTPKARAP